MYCIVIIYSLVYIFFIYLVSGGIFYLRSQRLGLGLCGKQVLSFK